MMAASRGVAILQRGRSHGGQVIVGTQSVATPKRAPASLGCCPGSRTTSPASCCTDRRHRIPGLARESHGNQRLWQSTLASRLVRASAAHESVLRDVAQIIWPLTGVATLPPVRSHKRLLVLLRIAGLVCRRKEAKPDRLGDEAGFATGLQLAAQGFQMKPDRGL